MSNLSSLIAVLAIENAKYLAIVNEFSENERLFAIAAYPVCYRQLVGNQWVSLVHITFLLAKCLQN